MVLDLVVKRVVVAVAVDSNRAMVLLNLHSPWPSNYAIATDYD